MKKSTKLDKLVRDIYTLAEDSISCDEARILIMRCSDHLFSEDETRKEYPQLFQHFEFCRSCERKYRDIMAVSQLEASGKLPKSRRILPMPPINPSPIERIRTAIVRIFSGFSPEVSLAVRSRRGAERFRPELIDFAPEPLILSLRLTNDHNRSDLRVINGFIEVGDSQLAEELEGTTISLESADGSAIVQESTVSDLGDFEFAEVLPATYSLWFRLHKREYAVTNLALP